MEGDSAANGEAPLRILGNDERDCLSWKSLSLEGEWSFEVPPGYDSELRLVPKWLSQPTMSVVMGRLLVGMAPTMTILVPWTCGALEEFPTSLYFCGTSFMIPCWLYEQK